MKDQTLQFVYYENPRYPDEYSYELLGSKRTDMIRMCPKGLQEYFDIPESAKSVFIRLSQKASANSYKVHTLPHSIGVGVVDSKGLREWKMMFVDTKTLLKRTVGELRTFYVSLEYSV